MFHRLSFVVLTVFLFFSSIVSAQWPTCAQPCLGATNPGNCGASDNACWCSTPAYTNPTNTCFKNSCSQADWKSAYNYSVSLCNQAGVTKPNVLNPPTKRAIAPVPTKRAFTPVYYGRPAQA